MNKEVKYNEYWGEPISCEKGHKIIMVVNTPEHMTWNEDIQDWELLKYGQSEIMYYVCNRCKKQYKKLSLLEINNV